uniref:Serine/threonine-protein kinase 19 isoform X3 n=1 Tax=Rhizophora mucronata TaxID=61149 RepID=A0A2P2K7Z1_RHIMU
MVMSMNSDLSAKGKKRLREEGEEKEGGGGQVIESETSDTDRHILSLAESLTFSDTLVALRMMRDQFPRIDKVTARLAYFCFARSFFDWF